MTKLSMMMTQDKDQKGKCFLCGNKNKMKKIWYYDASKSLDENKKNAAEKNNEKEEQKKKKEAEKKNEDGKTPSNDNEANPTEVHKGTIAQLPSKRKQTGMCLVKEL